MTLREFDDTEAFKVEQRGIDFVSHAERWARPRDIASLWAGVSTNIQYFVYGAILPVFGLPMWTAIAVVLIGNLSYLLLAVASLQGPVAGTTTFTISRASFGVRGSRVMSFSNWITQLGFETEGLLLIVGAVITLLQLSDVTPSSTTKVLVIVGATILMVALPLFGHATMVRVLRWLIAPFVAAYALLTFFISGHIETTTVSGHASDWQTLTLALAFSFTLAGLSWTENGNDYTRYLPDNVSKSKTVAWLFGATAIPQVLTMLVGYFTVASFAATSDWLSANPFAAFLSSNVTTGAQSVVPTWFVAVFLVMAIVQLFAINSLDLYSSGVSLQAMGLRLRRWQAVILDGVIAGSLTTWVTFASTFADFMRTFVGVVIIWITPWLAIYLTDWALRRRRYDVDALQDTTSRGRYYGFLGVNWNAVTALLVGMSLALAAYAKPFGAVNFPTKWMSPIAGHFGFYEESGMWGGLVDLSIPLGFFSAALLYYWLDRDSGYITSQESGRPLHHVATRSPLVNVSLTIMWTVAQWWQPSGAGRVTGLVIGCFLTGAALRAARHGNAARDLMTTLATVALVVTVFSMSYHANGTWWRGSLALAIALWVARWATPSTKPR